MLLYIVRHGHPDYETDSLTELGRQQAEAVGRRIARSGINRIYTSPMGRARQTAEPACRLLGLEYTVEEWTREIGEEGYTTYPDGKRKQLCGLPNTVACGADEIDLPFGRAFECRAVAETALQEKYEYIRAHGKEFLERLGYREENGVYRILRPSEEKVALFCHGLFGMTWISQLLHIPFHLMWGSFRFSHTGVTIFEFENQESGFTMPRCLTHCDLSHIYAEGLPMLYDNKKTI